MVVYSKEFLNKVAKAHRKFGITFRTQTRKGKQYVSISSRGVPFRTSTYWNSHTQLNDHIKAIFPQAYATSGSWGGGTFDVTYRVNP